MKIFNEYIEKEIINESSFVLNGIEYSYRWGSYKKRDKVISREEYKKARLAFDKTKITVDEKQKAKESGRAIKISSNVSLEDCQMELKIFIDGDGKTYKNQQTAIENNLKKKVEDGSYDPDKAMKVWNYFAKRAAEEFEKKYNKAGKFSEEDINEFALYKKNEFESKFITSKSVEKQERESKENKIEVKKSQSTSSSNLEKFKDFTEKNKKDVKATPVTSQKNKEVMKDLVEK